MRVILIAIGVAVFLAMPFVVAREARSKGRDYWRWFISQVFATAIAGLGYLAILYPLVKAGGFPYLAELVYFWFFMFGPLTLLGKLKPMNVPAQKAGSPPGTNASV